MKRLFRGLGGRLLTALAVIVVLAFLGGCGPGQTSTPTPAGSPTPPPIVQNTGPNHPPVIDVVSPEWTQIERGKSGLIKIIAHDPDGDALTYKWQTDRGSLSGDGDTVTFTAPWSYVNVTITVTVTDGRGGMVAGGASFPVVCCGEAVKNPEWVGQ